MRAVTKLKQSKADKNISDSGLVNSSQAGVHPRLETFVRKHLEASWAQPYHRPTMDTYYQLEQLGVFLSGRAVVLDSGCGTGESTQRLASLFPRHLVIGVDRSIKRLAKSGVTSGILRGHNFILVRAELATFWRLLLGSGISPERHFLLYPNPWPKPGHLSRRWHGHPVFPQLLALGGEIEMRCNWEVYAQEFAQAVSFATAKEIGVMKFHPDKGISPFEQKYLERGQPLFSVSVPAHHAASFRGSWLGTPIPGVPA